MVMDGKKKTMEEIGKKEERIEKNKKNREREKGIKRLVVVVI